MVCWCYHAHLHFTKIEFGSVFLFIYLLPIYHYDKKKKLWCSLVVITHGCFIHAVAELRSVQAQLVVIAANRVVLMLIAVMSVFSLLYTRPSLSHYSPHHHHLHHTVSAFSQPGFSLTAWASVDVHWFSGIPFAYLLHVCCVEILVRALNAWHETHAEMKNQLKIVVSRTDSLNTEWAQEYADGADRQFFSWIHSRYNFPRVPVKG